MGHHSCFWSRRSIIIMQSLVILSVLGCAFAVPLVQEAAPEVVANTVETAPSDIAPAAAVPVEPRWVGPHASMFAAGDARFTGLSDTMEGQLARNQFELAYDATVLRDLPAWRATPFLFNAVPI